MSGAEITADGKVALRVEVRTGDKWTTAAVQLPKDSQWLVLAQMPAQPYLTSHDVRAKFLELATAILRAIVAEVLPDATMDAPILVPPGAPIDSVPH